MRRGKNSKCAVVAQSVEHFLGKEEVRQFKSAQQLQQAKKRLRFRSLFLLGQGFQVRPALSATVGENTQRT